MTINAAAFSEDIRTILTAPISAYVQADGWRRLRGQPGLSEEERRLPSEIGESIRFRSDSAFFHHAWMGIIAANHHIHLQTISSRADRRGALRRASTQLLFVFDDIIFQIVAALDYFANLAAVTLAGMPQRQLKWAGLLREYDLRHKGPGQLALLRESRTAELASHLNTAWIKTLAFYRGELSHYRSGRPDGSVVTNLLSDTEDHTQFYIHVPRDFAALGLVPPPIHGTGLHTDKGKILISDASEWLLAQLHDSVTRLSLALWCDIRDAVGPRPAFPLGPFWLPPVYGAT